MIDDINQLIFVENPKCASTAVKQAVTGITDFSSINPILGTYSHLPPALIRQKYPDKWRNYRSFTIVRNTWDRALSFYQFYAVLMQAESFKANSFEQWVAKGCPGPAESHFMASLPRATDDIHVLCQLQYVEDVDRVISLHSVDSVGRYNELSTKLGALAEEWRFPLYSLHHNVNASGRLSDAKKWNQTSIDSIAELFRDEIRYFNFQPPG